MSENSEVIENKYKDIIEQIANNLGLDVPRLSNGSLQMCCPFHKESNPSFGINMTTGEYHCFTCGAKGHISKFSNNLMVHIVAETIEDIDNFKVSTKVDTTKNYTVKPNKSETASIQNRLKSMENIMKFKICDLITLIIRGHTVCASGNNRNDDWEMAQLWMLDFDNKDSNYTMEDVLDYAKSINLIPTFAYYSFSNTKKVPKFRFVYCFKEPITSKKRMQAIVDNLLKLFEDYSVDKSRRNLSSLFFGTNFDNDVFTSNYIYSIRFTDEQLDKLDSIIGTTTKTSNASKKYEEMAQDIIDKYHIKRTHDNLLYYYDKFTGVHIKDDNRQIERFIKKEYHLLKRAREEVKEFIELTDNIDFVECSPEFVACKNVILNMKTLETQPFNPTIVITNKVNAEYIPFNPSMKNDFVDNFMTDVTCRKQRIRTTYL
ncbi:MAG: hypothetical protein IJJ82_03910 [Clostridia bacterium]|nr:hypothetical protein [Clostridia bacterium]